MTDPDTTPTPDPSGPLLNEPPPGHPDKAGTSVVLAQVQVTSYPGLAGVGVNMTLPPDLPDTLRGDAARAMWRAVGNAAAQYLAQHPAPSDCCGGCGA